MFLQHTDNCNTVRGSIDKTVAFIKVEDAKSRFRPQFVQYDNFPAINLDGDLSCGIFSATRQRKYSPKMPVKLVDYSSTYSSLEEDMVYFCFFK